MHMLALDNKLIVHLSRAIQIAALQWDNAFTKVLAKYANYVNVFSYDLAIKLPKSININNYAIKQVEEKEPPYGPI